MKKKEQPKVKKSMSMILTNLTRNQVKLLLYLCESPNRSGFACGKEQGGSAAQLFRQGLINKSGRVGILQNWQAVDKIGEEPLNIKLLKEIWRSFNG